MEKNTFETIKLKLEARINECKKYLDNILTAEDLKNITIKEAQELKAWANKESAIMTEIVMVDFYHIIGMGKLTVLQTNTFIKLIKEYMCYRSDLKTIGTHFSIDNLPNLPSTSKFTLKQLGDITLTSEVHGRASAASTFIETNNVGDYKIAAQELSSVDGIDENITYEAFKIEDNTITFPTTLLSAFMNVINPNLSLGKVTSAAAYQKNTGKTYAKIFWRYTSDKHDEIKAIVSKKNGYFTGIKNKLGKAFTK